MFNIFKIFKSTPKNYTKWKVFSMTESEGWVTITQSRENLDSGLKEFKYEKTFVNCHPAQLDEMYKRVMKL